MKTVSSVKKNNAVKSKKSYIFFWLSRNRKCFFDDLRKYQKQGNSSLEVKVEYPTNNHNTNGGTEE